MALFTLTPESSQGSRGALGGKLGDFAPEGLLNATVVYEAAPTDGDGVIDVISRMQITGNDIPQYLREKLPFCILKEYELVTNSTVGQLLYYLKSLGYNRQADNFLTNSGVRESLNNFFNNATDKKGILRDFVGDEITNILATSVAPIQDILNSNEPLEGALTPYQNLYIRKPTQFKYILPYFENNKKKITTSFGETQTGLLQNNLFAKAADAVKGGYEKVARTLFAATPGAYIEQPKFFGAQSSGESYTVNFELINTIDGDKIQDHFDFLFLLAFQNLPYRRDIATVALPKIYTFIIPGEIYLPYAYISSMTIDFIGNRRMIELLHPKSQISGSPTPTKCIIPDAYSVSITIQGLTSPAANYMVADELFNIESQLVTVEPIPTVEVGPLTPIPLPGQGGNTGDVSFKSPDSVTKQLLQDLNNSVKSGLNSTTQRPTTQSQVSATTKGIAINEPSEVNPVEISPTAVSTLRRTGDVTDPYQLEIRRLIDSGVDPSRAFDTVSDRRKRGLSPGG